MGVAGHESSLAGHAKIILMADQEGISWLAIAKFHGRLSFTNLALMMTVHESIVVTLMIIYVILNGRAVDSSIGESENVLLGL